ncbi:hypothetical protein LWI29_025504 [Acer saccharum]|uniref:Uncharacterized protein n=1 Tax=Acer saccharum TaxID=4024 RepID=A0AA39T503_ACESA|nr:hypothetical protein LWI29_025504 [Acer saccharum]
MNNHEDEFTQYSNNIEECSIEECNDDMNSDFDFGSVNILDDGEEKGRDTNEVGVCKTPDSRVFDLCCLELFKDKMASASRFWTQGGSDTEEDSSDYEDGEVDNGGGDTTTKMLEADTLRQR